MSIYQFVGLTGVVAGSLIVVNSILDSANFAIEKPTLVSRIYEINASLKEKKDSYLESERDSIMTLDEFAEQREIYARRVNETVGPILIRFVGGGILTLMSMLYLAGIKRIDELESAKPKEKRQ